MADPNNREGNNRVDNNQETEVLYTFGKSFGSALYEAVTEDEIINNEEKARNK
jgi:hypothetical protein